MKHIQTAVNICWTYDAETDKFTRTDSDGKVIESYDRYHPDYEKNLTTEAPVTTESATQKQDKTYYEKAVAEQSSDVIGEETEERCRNTADNGRRRSHSR